MLHQDQELPGDFSAIDANIIVGRDSIPQQGPLQGISDATDLLPQETEYVFVLACDLPFLETGWLKIMLSRLTESTSTEVVVSDEGSFLNPLIAVYKKSVLEKAGSYLDAGKRSCQVLLDHHKKCCLDSGGSSPLVLSNVNTPEEYERALKMFESDDELSA
jgi:molybdenum cofactor guanylyltransferase